MGNFLGDVFYRLRELGTDEDGYRDAYFCLMDVLSGGVLEVRFLKRDGSFRDMICTRNEEYIRLALARKGVEEGRRGEDDEELLRRDMENRLIRVFDMGKEDFRSFRFDSVISSDYLGSL